MRVRRLSTLFWAACVACCVFILYVVVDMGFNLPSIKPDVMHESDDRKWASFEAKLDTIEEELHQHHAVVDQIQAVMDQVALRGRQEERPRGLDPKNRRSEAVAKPEPKPEPVVAEPPVFVEEPPVAKPPVVKPPVAKPPAAKPPVAKPQARRDPATCPLQEHTVPKTDIQMLSMYERIMFDDRDGGVWKQGWNIDYNEKQWSSKNKLKVFIVPHSHNDPGWIKTFESYYKSQTRAIFTNMVEKMRQDSFWKFIWAEVSYLSLWWASDASEQEKVTFKTLLNSGQLEIVTGGWVMNDEANSHWVSVAQQLTAGHQWLMDHLDYIPRNAWAIDPFGHSSSQPYLLKLAGLENSVIQRVHYRVKKELALNRQLEFKWRQVWDGLGQSDMFTHMMPFYSYDVPHTCGPDPKICCQFDFKRLPGNGVNCPWGVAPRKIVTKNVAERASVILEQWRKKAQLYRSNAVLIPLGDDFRYDRANEWDNQARNYEMLVDFINNNDAWNAEVQIATLEDYFKAVHKELKASEFPVLSGDFFTYADRNQHYWSGYYTSRPFYKNMDRVLLAYLGAAESITAQATVSGAVTEVVSLSLRDRVRAARQSLALFQHHDGITGTSRDEVRADYADKLLQAIRHCQSSIQQAAFHLLQQPKLLEQTDPDVYFDVDDMWRARDEVPARLTISLDAMSKSRRLVLYNPLLFTRREILTFLVSSPDVEVFDPEGKPMMAQLSPVVSGEQRLGFANKYQLSFPVGVPPLALATYTVALRDLATINKYTSYARVRVYNADYWTIDLPKAFVVEQPSGRLEEDLFLRAGGGARLAADSRGRVKTLLARGGGLAPVHMDFVQYGSQKATDNNSGAYLFIPDGPAREAKFDPYPEIVTVEGPFKATLYTALKSPGVAQIVMAITLYDNPALPQTEVEISNTFLVDPEADDVEFAMRFSTPIENGDVFYTDVNGMQMIKRRYFEKLPLQANFYPLPAAAYIEDDHTRLTLLTSTPLGMAALKPGQIEVMQDRRLSRDDNRGLFQGVTDNVRTRHTFRLVVEPAAPCDSKPPADHPAGQLTVGAHVSQQTLLRPLVAMHYAARDVARPAGRGPRLPSSPDLVLAAYNAHVAGKTKNGVSGRGVGLTFQRVHLDRCYGDHNVTKAFPLGDGLINVAEMTGAPAGRVFDSSLTFVHIKGPVDGGTITLCPMEVRSVFINTTARH